MREGGGWKPAWEKGFWTSCESRASEIRDIFIECGGVRRKKPRINTRKKTPPTWMGKPV